MTVYFQRKNFLTLSDGHPLGVTCFILLILLSYNSFSQTENLDITGTDPVLANAYFSLADSLSKAAQYDSAIYYYKKSAMIYKDEKKWVKYFKCYNQIGGNYRHKGLYSQSLLILNQTLDSIQNKSSQLSVHTDELKKITADILNNIAGTSYFLGKYDKALNYMEKVLHNLTNLVDPDSFRIAQSYNNIGILYMEKGNYHKAMDYYKKALSIVSKLHSNKNRLVLVLLIYNNMGVIYRLQGDYQLAMDYQQQSLRIRLQLYGSDHPDVASSYTNIGNIFGQKGEMLSHKEDYLKAIEYHNRALAIRLKTFGAEHPATALTYSNLGISYEHISEHVKAFEYMNKALSIRLKYLGNKHPLVAHSYHNFGVLFAVRNEYDSACYYYEKAIKICKNTFGNFHPLVGSSYTSFGNIYSKQREFSKALQYFQKALQSLVEDFNHVSIYLNPVLKIIHKPGESLIVINVNSTLNLLDALEGKAGALEMQWKTKNE